MLRTARNLLLIFLVATLISPQWVEGQVGVLRAARALLADGTSSAPAYSWANDADLGLYRIGADELGVAGNAALRGPRPWVDVRAYGVSGSATAATNDTGFTNAIAAVPSAGGTIVITNDGSSILVSTPKALPSNIRILGLGMPTIKVADASTALNSAGVFQATSKDQVRIEGIIIDGNKANQTVSIFGIVLTNTTNASIENVTVKNTSHVGIFLDATTSQSPYYVYRATVTNAGSLAIVPGGSSAVYLEVNKGSVLEDVVVDSPTLHGFQIANSDYVRLVRPKSISATKRGISAVAKYLEVIEPYITNSGWSGMELDGYGGVGHTRVIGGLVELSGAGTPFTEGNGAIFSSNNFAEVIGLVSRNNAIANGTTEAGGIVFNTIKYGRIIGTTSEYNGGPGIELFSNTETRIIGGTVRNNGQKSGTGSPYGVDLGNDAVTPSSGNHIIGLRAFDDQGTKTQSYGVVIKAGAGGSSNNKITDSDLTGNGTGGYSDASGVTGTNVNAVFNTRGVNPAAVATITVTASPFTYTNNDGYIEQVSVSGGTVSSITLRGTSTGLTSGMFALYPGDALVVTYSVAPTMTKFPM